VILLSGYVDALGLSERSTGADAVLMKSASEPKQLTQRQPYAAHEARRCARQETRGQRSRGPRQTIRPTGTGR